MYARVPQVMAQFVLKIEKLSHIMGPNPILEMARAYGFRPRLCLLISFKVDGTSFPDAGSLVTTAHVTREICPRDLKYRKSKTNTAAQKLLHTMWLFSCLSEIGSKRKLSFERQLLSNSVCVRKTLFVMLEIQG